MFFLKKDLLITMKKQGNFVPSPRESHSNQRGLILNKIQQELKYEGNCRKNNQAAAYAVFQAKLLMRVPGFPTRKDKDHMYE